MLKRSIPANRSKDDRLIDTLIATAASTLLIATSTIAIAAIFFSAPPADMQHPAQESHSHAS